MATKIGLSSDVHRRLTAVTDLLENDEESFDCWNQSPTRRPTSLAFQPRRSLTFSFSLQIRVARSRTVNTSCIRPSLQPCRTETTALDHLPYVLHRVASLNSICRFAEPKIESAVDPEIRATFDSLGEAYSFSSRRSTCYYMLQHRS